MAKIPLFSTVLLARFESCLAVLVFTHFWCLSICFLHFLNWVFLFLVKDSIFGWILVISWSFYSFLHIFLFLGGFVLSAVNAFFCKAANGIVNLSWSILFPYLSPMPMWNELVICLYGFDNSLHGIRAKLILVWPWHKGGFRVVLSHTLIGKCIDDMLIWTWVILSSKASSWSWVKLKCYIFTISICAC